MDPDLVMLSRLQFAFTISFHIIFPSFTIGLAAWLAVLDGLWLKTGNSVYRRTFEYWLKIFAVAFGMGVVSGIVMGFQFGTNWSELSARAGNIMGPLLAYESYTAFLLEATFLGVLFFGRERLPGWAYFLSCCMVAIGTSISAIWIMINNSWMQVPVGFEIVDGVFIPTDWHAIIFNQVVLIRTLHMFLAAYLTTAFVIAATGYWLLLKRRADEEGRLMVSMSLRLAAIIIPLQLFIGHVNGTLVTEHQPAKLAAIEARWDTEQPASLVLLGWPDEAAETNRYAVVIPGIGGLVDAGNYDARMPGLKTWPKADRPPVLIPFFGFRIMVAMGALMLFIAWTSVWLRLRGRLFTTRWFQRITILAFPAGWVAVLSGWFVAEVGRQPWTVYGYLRTLDSHSPITSAEVATSLGLFVVVYFLVMAFGVYAILRLIKAGIKEVPAAARHYTGQRPMRVTHDGP